MPSRSAHALPRALSVGLALCTVWCASCSTKPPGFKVMDIAISRSTPEATILDVTLEGSNANKEPLPLYEIRYTMAIDGESVATATRSPQATIPAHGTQVFRIPVTVPVSIVEPGRLASAEYRISGSVTYELPGTIAQLFFDSNIRRPSEGFSETGSFAPEIEVLIEPQEAPPAN